MRISKGYWLWGLFPSKETHFLNEIKAKVQNKLKSPIFKTHITIAGPYLKINSPFLKKLKTFVKNNSFIMLNLEGYDFQKEKFKSFYISISNSKNLEDFRKNIHELNKFDLDNNYFPHISLSYGNHDKKEKKELIPNLPKFDKPIKMSKIALVEVCGDINLWRILHSFDLKMKS